MIRRFLASVGVLALVIALVSLAPAPVAGQVQKAVAKTSPHTQWGDPDLQGIWASNSATPLERPKQLAGRQALTNQEVAALQKRAAELFDGETDAAFGESVFEAALADAKSFKSRDAGTGNYNQFWLVNRWFDNRTSLIVDPSDGRIPTLTPEAQKRQGERTEYGRLHPADGPEDRSLGERCIGRTLPMTGRGYNSNYQIFQAPGYVAINMEMMHDTRIIPLDGRPHIDNDIRGYMGDSRGHWEGNTLVVETTNLKGGRNNDEASENLRLIERFTRVDAETLHYEYTNNDSTTWTRPWTAMIIMKPAPGTGYVYEFACHEGNHGMVGILSGHRAQEKAAEEAAKKGSN